MHEASLYERNCFLTLTYDDDHIPYRGMLEYPAFQKFMKRLRKFAHPIGQVVKPVRFYMCGEYGPENWRPHYHACIFNFDFDDKQKYAKTGSGEQIYRSESLEKLWPYGFSSIGAVTFESAAYVARYCVQKITGHNAKLHYQRQDADGVYQLPPEFNHMSLKPGIGAQFYGKYQSDIYPHDYVVVRGKEMKPPKYYDKLFKKNAPDEFEFLKFERELSGRANYQDNTPERLAVKEIVTRARASFLQRNL